LITLYALSKKEEEIKFMRILSKPSNQNADVPDMSSYRLSPKQLIMRIVCLANIQRCAEYIL